MWGRGALAALLIAACGSLPAAAAEIVLKDGRVLRGRVGLAPGLAEKPQLARPEQGAPIPQLVVIIDDDLRRRFVPKRQIAEVREGVQGEVLEKFKIKQAVRDVGSRVQDVGVIERIEPFDEYGRRTFTMSSDKGPVAIFQGITEITPLWTKVEGLNYVWDLRLATSSIPRDALDRILRRQIDPRNVEQRLQLARLYLQSERYQDAGTELDEIVRDFPEVRQQIEPQRQSLAQLGARRLLTEIQLRSLAGQHALVASLLEKFPSEGVAGDTLQAVRSRLSELESKQQQGRAALARIDQLLAEVQDSPLRDRLRPARDEIAAEISLNTLPRLAAFERLADDATLEPAQRLALAVSGWIGGSSGATQDVIVALSIYQIRNLVAQYLAEPVAAERSRILNELRAQEAATPELVARLIDNMRPPFPLPEPRSDAPGLYELPLRLTDQDPDSAYLVQLPPEYDPHLRYPAVVTLNAAFTTPEQQIDWWAGAPGPDGVRAGQATRQGYIVIAPHWARDGQIEYDFSARAHAAVLNALRDACRRFSIDTDRVFLSGHSMGGDAAWDIAWAHPDLWAGAVPITAVALRYTDFYWENGRYVPLYVIGGELDGGKSVINARNLDRCFIKGYNVTVAEFLGRGHENFSDEILDVFDWMARCRRDFFPKQFSCATLRRWDNYFWWVEVDGFPERVVVEPSDWPPPRGTRAMRVEGVVSAANTVQVRTGADRVTIWLAPEIVDFGRKYQATVNGRRVPTNQPLGSPNLEVLLEDVRTRGDRQHPFWAKLESR